MANREIEAILKISSKLGSMAALKTLERQLMTVNRQATAFNRANAALETRGRAAWMAMARATGPALLGIGGTALALERSYVAYAGIERRLNRIAINAGQGKQAVSGMLKAINAASQDYAMAQDDVTAGLETLIAAGRSAEDAMSFLPSVVATAQAAGAEITDIATTADAVSASFGIAGDNMQKAFDILVTAGKQGKFELKDMAQYLPTLAPAFAALGYKGEAGLTKLAAILQTIRIRTGDASEAATDAQNIFQKMNSTATIAAFKKFGVDLPAGMAKARKEGRDLVDAFVDLTNIATKGDLSKLPQLFADAQFQAGMRALIQGGPAMEQMQQALANVDGATLHDLGEVLTDNQAKIDKMSASWDRFKTSLGEAVAPAASAGLDFLSEGMSKADAINTTLEKQGYSFWERRGWWATHGFDEQGQGALAFQSGWRSPEGKLAAQGPMGRSPELPSRRQDATGFRGGVPIPTARPDPRMVLPDLRLDRFPPIGAGYVAEQDQAEARRARDEMLRRRARRARRGAELGAASASGDANYDEFQRAAGGAGAPGLEKVGDDIKSGGEAAGQSIEEAARAINQAGQDGGNAFARMLEGMGTKIGVDAATAFKANIGTLNVNVNARVSGGRDLGQSGGDVARGGGPR